LFTLGLGAYDEHDVREAARAFTGWRVRRGRTEFVARRHDDGDKAVCGRTGLRDGDDVIEAALAQPAAARFLADKLVREFVSGHPDDALVAALAAHLRATDFDIASALRTLLASRAMHDPRRARSRIKSPVEFVIGLARLLAADATGPELADATARLGQRLFEPPSVEGWKGGRAWLDSTTMLMRLHAVDTALASERFDAAQFVAEVDGDDRDALLAAIGALTLDGAVPAALAAPLAALGGAPADVVRDALRLLLSAPEYQLS
jgi:uncharacterized protein (DUF1800 family)